MLKTDINRIKVPLVYRPSHHNMASFCGLLIVTGLTYDENEYAQLTVTVFYSVCI